MKKEAYGGDVGPGSRKTDLWDGSFSDSLIEKDKRVVPGLLLSVKKEK
jgi:hypothetical protein